ncbi:hypothetical protein QQF64_022633, partial [Cirrhinus molitorella]
VDPNPYYENCVRDSCACDIGGDCECFCTAVAAYAQACNRSGVCVDWRTPDICPVYCDYYNKPEGCTWHYNPCGIPCYKTCRNPLGICNNNLPNLEGEPILDKKHIGSGICLTMTCSITCAILNSTEPCPPSPPTPAPDCPKWNKTTNQTFSISNCAMAKCIKGDVLEIVPLQCPPLQNFTCQNYQPKVLVYDKHQCCQQYACDCFCQGWGNSHYITFDGLFYSYQGNCTYILMEEIRPRYHLKIYIDKVKCDIGKHASCPRSITVSYNDQIITLGSHIEGADLEVRPTALKDNVKLTLPYAHNGVRVISSGLDLFLSIPELNVDITFRALGFSINLPFQHFGDNTQGHCGTCNNNQADDCMIPRGILVNDCAVMADHWPAIGVNSKNCQPPSIPPGQDKPKTPCLAQFECNLLESKLFEACHSRVSPKNYLLACQLDSCNENTPTMACASLQSYASACSKAGVCIHWRNYTKHCRCLDSSGTPHEYGEHFTFKCEDCVCDKASQLVTCKPKKCPDVKPESCSEPGFALVNITDPSNPCCTKQVCHCTIGLCPSGSCTQGTCIYDAPDNTSHVVKIGKEFKYDCETVTCHQINGSFVIQKINTECPYLNSKDCGPDGEVDSSKCETVTCQKLDGLFVTEKTKTECPYLSSFDCGPGFNYVRKEEECCGTCRQVACIYDAPDKTRQILKEGKEYNFKCVNATCQRRNGMFMTMESYKQCPPFNPDDCVPGTVHFDKDGCCQICETNNCVLVKNITRLQVNGCTSIKDVEVTSCRGHCDDGSRYSAEKNAMMHNCSCCQEENSDNRQVMLKCANGEEIPHNYIYVQSCKCTTTTMVVNSMGAVRMSQMWMLRWVILLVGLQSIQAEFMSDYEGMDVISDPMWPTTTTTVVPKPDHRSTICSTWGNFHFKTFDGHFFQVADTCNYVMAVMCDTAISDFNIQMQRETVNGSITFSTVTIVLDGTIVKITNGDITVGEEMVSVPTYKNGIKIEGSPTSVKISNKHGVTVFWEEDNSLTIELPEKYQGLTCGLCGDFNGNKDDDIPVSGRWKISTPGTETCEDVTLPSRDQCNQTSVCQKYLSSPGFDDCYRVMDMSSFEKACVDDLCQCYGNHDCLCNTLTEISRQCTHAGGKPRTWRTEELCPKTCPLNLEYMECGGPCKSTCSDPDADLMCKEHCVDGCFCPAGTVEDDISQTGCVHVNECPCVHNGTVYRSGESYKQACKKCECAAGHWTCTYLECPGICSIVGGSHITTYDGKTFTFSGNCDYILTKHSNDSDIAVVGNLAKCDPARKDTCLNSVTLVIPGTTVSFSSSGSVAVNGINLNVLPFTTGPVSIFQPSSSFIIADMKSVRLEIQLTPVMQLYIVASTEEKGKMSGLCGNYNDVQKDDFKTGSDIIEGTPTSFVNFWKQNCPDLEITFDNPCSLNIETEKIAKDWCSRLTNPNDTFSACHSEICPEMYYQWCVYDTCKCADIKKCMCAAVSNYAHACAARGIIFQDWMDSEPYAIWKCPGNMKYSYGVTSCGSTCQSLSEQENTCQGSFTPVDGCICSEGTYLKGDSCVHADQCPCYYGNQVSMGCVSGCMCPDDLLADGKGGCVTRENCPCTHNGGTYLPGEQVQQDCNTCTCTNGMWTCTEKACYGTCTVYGEGHFKTFDGRRYSFHGDCEHTIVHGKVCGLCGNFDGNANNDFMKHNGEVVTDPEDFGNSWKMNPDCPDLANEMHPCDANPHRRAWAVKQCRIITGPVFTECHSLVDSAPYYDACERDTCACDSGGDCECLCTAVAAYAAECRKRGACVAWRRPDFCPLFCDYYNAPGECEWHYKTCGSNCMKTCSNPSGKCSDQIPPLEGCFLQCPSERPYLREETMKCVTEEGCKYCFYDGKYNNNYINRDNTYINRITIYNYWYNNNYINRDIHNHLTYCNDNTYINRNNYINRITIYNYWYNNNYINRNIHNHLPYCNNTTYINRNTINN